MARKLTGQVAQLCAGNLTGGTTCWWVDQPRPRDAVGPAFNPSTLV